MATLKQIVEDGESTAGKAFEATIQVLIVASLAAFSIETLPNLSAATRWWLNAFEIFTVIAFTIEYLLRLYVAKPKRDYVFSFFGLVDLAAILPFYILSGVDLRSVRALRLLRLFRLLKLARYNAAMQRFHRALLIAREEIVLFLGFALILLYLAAVGIYYFESEAQPNQFGSVLHCLWWAVATLTTVGYGDVYPITPGGKIFTFFVLLIGLGVISIPAGLLASALGKARQMEDEENRQDGDRKPDDSRE